jgi:hypothetical protein
MEDIREPTYHASLHSGRHHFHTDWHFFRCGLYRVSHKSRTTGEICNLAKYEKIYRGKSCCISCVSNIKGQSEPLRRYTLYIISSNKLRRCCHVDMTTKEGCLSRVGGTGSEGDTGNTGNTKWTKPGEPKRLGTVMSTLQHRRNFLQCCKDSKAATVKKIQHLRLETHDLQQLFPLYNFPYFSR